MIVARHLHVKCVNKRCPRPADAQVPVPEVAPGVLAVPTPLICAACDHDLMRVSDDA